MKAGQTDINVKAKIKIKELTGEDKDLSGLLGQATHPFAFGCTCKGWIGVWLDNGSQCNVRATEVELL